MVMVCFVLDLRTLPPPLMRDLKQSLLQLANLYAISRPHHQSEFLRDRIGLCYVLKNLVSCSDQLKIAYSPRGSFSLRDFHHAVNNLPTDAFSPEINDSGAMVCHGVKLSTILSEQVLYSLGEKVITSKVIVLSSCVPADVDSVMQKALTDAAEKCVSVEFVLFEQKWSHLSNMQESINNFVKCTSDIDNCSFHTYLPDVKVLHGLVKRWLQELKEDMEESLQARFIFKSKLTGSVNQINCNLFKSVNQIIDGFSPCQTCRCHGIPLSDTVKDKTEGHSCPVSGQDLGTLDVIENSVKVGEKTLLFLPSFQSCMKLQHASSIIDFNIIERTNLGSLNEGVVFGASYIVVPYSSHEIESPSDESDQFELNAQVFQALCRALHALDQGLLCSSDCNIETMVEAAFHCYYLLQLSQNGPMLLRVNIELPFNGLIVCLTNIHPRLAGSEEALPIPDVTRLSDSSVSKEIEDSIQTSLLKMESRDYNPILHERGFHKRLNILVKESLQFGSIPPKLKEATSEPHSALEDSSEMIFKSTSAIDVVVMEETTPMVLTAGEDKNTDCITEEWEQLVVNEVPKLHSPTYVSKPKLDRLILSPIDGNRQLDVKTSRILERLEVPRQLKMQKLSPITTSNSMTNTNVPTKKPLIPFQSIHASDQALTASQLMKPSFQRVKRKHR